jgi:Fic family protein
MAQTRLSNTGVAAEPAGHAWLRERLQLEVPAPAHFSFVGGPGRRSEAEGGRIREFYPSAYALPEEPIAHLRFALRHEPTDLTVLVAALGRIAPKELEAWVSREPTGTYARRAWFLYETFVGERLDVPDANLGNYALALDPQRHLVGPRRNSRRHRVADNLLGDARFAPTVRRTAKLVEAIGWDLDARARSVARSVAPALLERAVRYLFTRETRSSFAIEGETPSSSREARFVAALTHAPKLDPTNAHELAALQAQIVDKRFAAEGWRSVQNYVGHTVAGYREVVDYACPRPEDVDELMRGWAAAYQRLLAPEVDAVTAAAVVAFGFVLLHPFLDGNGRIHRLLLHHVLARRGFGPEDVILPVSSSIVRDRRGYDAVLERYANAIAPHVEWAFGPEGDLRVLNDTAHLYRTFDATHFVEYTFDRLRDAIDVGLSDELDFLELFDRALAGVAAVVDLPDRRARELVQLVLQNDGRLAARKRDRFAELTDAEVAACEAAIVAARGARVKPVLDAL